MTTGSNPLYPGYRKQKSGDGVGNKKFTASVAMEADIVSKALHNLLRSVNGLLCDNNLADAIRK